jgi:hypothetical protein
MIASHSSLKVTDPKPGADLEQISPLTRRIANLAATREIPEEPEIFRYEPGFNNDQGVEREEIAFSWTEGEVGWNQVQSEAYEEAQQPPKSSTSAKIYTIKVSGSCIYTYFPPSSHRLPIIRAPFWGMCTCHGTELLLHLSKRRFISENACCARIQHRSLLRKTHSCR